MKKRTRIRIIYTRYILPPILMLLTFLTMLIPSYKYVIDGAINDAISPLRLMSNSFDAARRVIFAVGEKNASDVLFSRTVMILIIVFALAFLVALAASVYSAAVVLRYLKREDEQAAEKSRILFVTLIPNRIVLCVLQSLFLPLAIFPYLLPYLYDVIWSQYVGMALMAPDALIVGGVFFVATVVLCIVSASSEKALDANVFKRRKDFEDSEDPYVEQDEAPEMSDEQNEKIRRILLGEKQGGDKTKNTENTENTEDLQ